jgi:cation:H+ antiporter
MAAPLAVPLFLVSLAVTLGAARLFARRLDRLGVRFGFPEALIGLLTAVAADGPNVSSALFALAKGAHNVGVGVLVGSNAFQLAAMIGLSALLAGGVRLARETLALEGLVGLLITVLAAALLFRWLSPVESVVLTALVLVPYLTLVIAGAGLLDRLDAGRGETAVRQSAVSRLARALHEHPGPDRTLDTSPSPTHHLLGLIVVDVALIIAGSAGMVQAALSLGTDWHIPSSVLGVLILAPMTSLPNAATAVRLGLAGRGAALVGETFNSNSINLGAGVIVPSLFVSFAALTTVGKEQLGWLVAMTVATLAMLARPRGMGRAGAAGLIILYFAFVAGTLVG